MKVNDRKAWDDWKGNNTDPYGNAIFQFAERWANMMEERMSEGEKLEDVATECSCVADTEGITGYMYGAAVAILAQCWVHGETLRWWHNLDCQVENEGEAANKDGTVLNPALITIK